MIFLARQTSNEEDEELYNAYEKLTGSDIRVNNSGCGCLPFITVTLVAVILLFLLFAGAALLMNS